MKNGRSVLWIIAMGLAALVVAGVLALAYYVPRAVKVGRQFLSEEQDRSRVAAGWTPPGAEAGMEAWFPARLGPWERKSTDAHAHWEDFPADFEGTGAVYERDGRRVSVLAFPVSPLEAEALEGRLTRGRSRGDGSRTTLVTPVRMLFEHSRPEERVEVWRVSGWWILLHSPGSTGAFDGLPEAFFARRGGA